MKFIRFGLIFSIIAVLLVGVVAAQNAWEGKKWEYLYVSTINQDANATAQSRNPQLGNLTVNGEIIEFEGSLFEAFNALGNVGWEYVEQAPTVNGITAWIFKRERE